MPGDDPQIIWENRLDRRFHVRVERIDGETGRLTITDSVDPAQGGLGSLADEVVPLHFGAAFGPDGQDVARWMDRSVKVVDAAIASPPAASPGDA